MMNMVVLLFNPFAGAAGLNLVATGVWLLLVGLSMYALIEKRLQTASHAAMTDGQRAIAAVRASKYWKE